MKVYVITFISTGEVPLEFDSQYVYKDKTEAEKAFRLAYDSLVDIEHQTPAFARIEDNYCQVIIEDDDSCTVYQGYLKEYEV